MSESLKFKMTMSLSGKFRLVALVEGGWKFPWATTPAFLLDSNALSLILDTSALIPEEQEWWKKLLQSDSTILNILPKAFEGNTGLSFPTFDEFEDILTTDMKKLSGSYPHVTLIRYSSADLLGIYELVKSSASYGSPETKFLIDAAPIIASHSKVSSFNSHEADLFELAQIHGLRNDSLSFFLALSCLYSRHGSEDIARKVVKPSTIIKTGGAHNAFADINLLRLFISTLCLSKLEDLLTFSLLTADHPLVALWCGLGIHNLARSENGDMVADYEFSEKLFPCLDDTERIALADRVNNL